MAVTHISIALGIVIGLLASFVQSLGLTIQRKSHVLNERLPEHEQRLEYRRPLWLLGFAIFISSNILGSLVQIASLPVVILAPLGAVSLLWNAFFARILLGDVFSAWMVLGTLLIAGGAVLIAVFGIVPEPTRSLEDLLELFRRPTFVVYFSLLGAVVLVSLIITHVSEYRLYKRFPPSDITPTPSTPTETDDAANLTTGITQVAEEAIPSETTPLISRKAKSSDSPSRPPSFVSTKSLKYNSYPPTFHRTRLWLAISYASFSGILSGMCLLFAKSGVELLLLTVQGDNQFWRWESWVLLLGLVVFALLQLWYLHKGLILADPTLVCPSAFCFYNLSSIVNGLVYFDQFALISPLHLCLVALGIVVLLAGVWVVSIHAGGGAVDLSWNESTELSDDIPQTASPTEIETGESSPLLQSAPEAGDDLEWGTMSEPLLNAQPASPELTASPPAHTHRAESSPTHTRSRTSASHRRRPTLDPLYTQTSPTRHSRISSHNTPYFNSSHNGHLRAPLSPPLHRVSALAGAGFQIGLSPVSPGFAILPLDRRRRVSNLGGNSEIADSPSLSLGIGRPSRSGAGERRRTVSEGDMGGRAGSLIQNAPATQSADVEGSEARRGEETQTPEIEGTETRGSGVWGWLRKKAQR
ncbi:hypothetical protein PQX77_003266 [Marasmius sp. AFHP31]|nr:hypothetical protein PQX77_003266 [Marasmius sp. AFHP31]